MFKPVDHIIFDIDGLLLDTEVIYEKMISSIARKYGKTYTHEIQLKVLGTKSPDTETIAVREMNLPITPDEFYQQYLDLGKIELAHPSLTKGAERLIKHFAKHKIPMAVATSSSRVQTDLKFSDHLELFSNMSHIVAGSDAEVKNGKPAPDIFLICASKFSDKPKSEKCLVFEDAPNGVKAANSAGMQVVMVPSTELSPDFKSSASLVLKSLEDFKPELFGLPALD